MTVALFFIMFINAAELAVINTLFCLRLEKRPRFFPRVLGLLVLTLVYIFLIPVLRVPYALVHIPFILLSFAYVGCCYRTTPVQMLFIGIAAYTIKHISSLLNSIVTWIWPDVFVHFTEQGSIGLAAYALILGLDLLCFAAAYILIARHMGNAELEKNATLSVVLLGAVVLVTNQFWSIGLSDAMPTGGGSIYVLMGYVWNLICCMMCLFVQFHIFSGSRKDRELAVTKKLIAEKERQYKQSKYTVEAINRKCHDLKYQLAALSAGQDSQKHIEEALELVDSFDSAIHTGNETLDIIFSEKSSYCQKHDINFVCMIDGEKLGFMEAADQYVLFGNLIDNAINAVRKIPDHSSRSIYVTVRAEKKLLLIQTENPFLGQLEFLDGLPKTTSGDEFNHGFGMTSIRLIAEKYGGSVNALAENQVFYLNIVIPI